MDSEKLHTRLSQCELHMMRLRQRGAFIDSRIAELTFSVEDGGRLSVKCLKKYQEDTQQWLLIRQQAAAQPPKGKKSKRGKSNKIKRALVVKVPAAKVRFDDCSPQVVIDLLHQREQTLATMQEITTMATPFRRKKTWAGRLSRERLDSPGLANVSQTVFSKFKGSEELVSAADYRRAFTSARITKARVVREDENYAELCRLIAKVHSLIAMPCRMRDFLLAIEKLDGPSKSFLSDMIALGRQYPGQKGLELMYVCSKWAEDVTVLLRSCCERISPHPCLEGGCDPSVRMAGTFDLCFEEGIPVIASAWLDSGHFMPLSDLSLERLARYIDVGIPDRNKATEGVGICSYKDDPKLSGAFIKVRPRVEPVGVQAFDLISYEADGCGISAARHAGIFVHRSRAGLGGEGSGVECDVDGVACDLSGLVG